MNRVSNYNELSKLIFLYLRKGVLTNTFISREEFEKEIKQGNLYYISFDYGLFIFRDRGAYYILNYYLKNSDSNSCPERIINDVNRIMDEVSEKNIVVEIVGKKEEYEKYNSAINIFNQIGFDIQCERERYSKAAQKNEKMKLDEKTSNTNYADTDQQLCIVYCDRQDFDDVKSLLDYNFDKYFGCIPTQDVLKQEIIDRKIYKAVMNNKLVGILHFKTSNKSAEIRHLAVDKNYRNKNIASELVKVFNEDLINTGIVWTGSDNISAQKVYEKNDYKKDGFISTVFIKKQVYKK